MARTSPQIEITQIPGDRYAGLHEAHAAAIDDLSLHLAQIVRDLIASGCLVNVNGKIIPTRTGETHD
jgi:hypothetical protein